jgi:hypothetical protein
MSLRVLSCAFAALMLLVITDCVLDLDALTAGTGGAGGGATVATASSVGSSAATGGTGGTGGAGGMGGMAGAGNVPSGALTVEYKVQVPYLTNDDTLKPHFKIINVSAADIPLDDITVHYWYTNEGVTSEVFNCDYAMPNVCGQADGDFFVHSPSHPEANRDMQLSFMNSGVTLVATGGTQEIHTRAQATANFMEMGDYSYDATEPDAFVEAPTITAYVNGELAWGTEPLP